MKLWGRSYVALFLSLLCHFLLSGQVLGHTVTFYVHNKCPFPIWPATAPNTGHPVIAGGGFYLPSGETQPVTAPWSWTGRIWARTCCNFGLKPACETGDCDGRLECNGLIGTPPATLVQITVQADRSKPSFYDVSLVDGYNLPVMVTTRQMSPKCTITGCVKNLKGWCPQELQVLNRTGQEVVACKSPCLAFNLDSYCCRNEYGTPETCKASWYSKLFKEACPAYYSYAYDMPPPLMSCSSKEFVITFCPSGWGDHDEQHSSI
ncbi:hypothetical protein ACOSQ2_029317 [Xanthoceras sorbifolium]